MNQANSRCLWDSVGQRSWLPAICHYKERPPNDNLVNITLNSLWLINRNHAWNPCRTCWLFSAHFSHLFAPRCPKFGWKGHLSKVHAITLWKSIFIAHFIVQSLFKRREGQVAKTCPRWSRRFETPQLTPHIWWIHQTHTHQIRKSFLSTAFEGINQN